MRSSSRPRRSVLKWLGTSTVMGLIPTPFIGCQSQDPNKQFNHFHLMSDSTPPLLEGDQSLPWWSRGNYAPLERERYTEQLDVIGSIPTELNGSFIRNGSNPINEDPLFWFFGDGMLHRIKLGGGQAHFYDAKLIDTPASRGEQTGLIADRASTSLIFHAEKLLALYEVSLPFEIDPLHLTSKGFHDFDGALSSPMCAHPKIDPLTGEMWFIGINVFPPQLSCTAIDAKGKLLKSDHMALDAITFMHDFQLTEHFVVLFDFPFEINPAVINGEHLFNWDPDKGARIGLMPRQGTLSTIQWFDVEPAYAFHSFNAYEEADTVVIEACRLIPTQGGDVFMSGSPPIPWQWRLNTQTGQCSEFPLLDIYTDFPMIDRRRQGLPYSVNYGLMMKPSSPDYPVHPYGLYCFNRVSGDISSWDVGETLQMDEAIFVPDSPDAGEDEGWLLSIAYHRAEARSELLIFNAQSIHAGPVARIILPERVPFGFHGLWIPS